MLTFTIPSGTNTDEFARLLAEAGIQTSMIVEGTQAQFPELTEDDRPAVTAVWNTYQQRQNERQQILDAMSRNDAFVADTNVTQAEAVAQVKDLSRQFNGLVTILNRRGILT